MSIPLPEEKASVREIHQSKVPGKVLKGIGSVAATGVGAPAILGRIAPLLNNFIPANLAMKGLSKIDPRLGKFLNGITSSGYTIDQGLDYLRSKVGTPEQQQQAKPSSQPQQSQQDPFAFIEQYSPEVADALSKFIDQGFDPAEAAQRLKVSYAPQFGGFIQSIEQDTGEDFSDLVNRLFGGSPIQRQKQPPRPQLAPQQPQPQTTQGGIDPALLQGINALREQMAKLRQ